MQKGKIGFNIQAGYECEVAFESFQHCKDQCIANRSDAQGLIYNQSTKEVKNKLEARSDFYELQNDPFKLSIDLKELTHNYEDSKYYIWSVMTSLYNFFNVKQEHGESLVDYAKRFKNAKDIKDNLYGSFNLKRALSRTWLQACHTKWAKRDGNNSCGTSWSTPIFNGLHFRWSYPTKKGIVKWSFQRKEQLSH